MNHAIELSLLGVGLVAPGLPSWAEALPVLRRKLEAHGPRLIGTLRGRGYRFGTTEGGE